jgi:hypothetical protein
MATACVRSISLERSARLQSIAETLGSTKPIDSRELSETGVSQGLTQAEINAQWDYWKIEAY